MSLLIYIVLCLSVSGIGCVTEEKLQIITKLPLCCPTGWFLVRTSHGNSNSNQYDCTPSQTQRGNLMSADSSSVFQSTYPVYGFGIEKPEEHISNVSIPECENHTLVILYADGGDVRISRRACIVRTEIHIGIISCGGLSNEDKSLTLSFIHKCCPYGHLYNANERKCVASPQTNYIVYKEFFPEYAIFSDIVVECPRHKVLVEYRINAFHFRKRYRHVEYCIEGIEEDVDNKRNLSDSLIKSHNRSSHFLLRTCENVDVCHKLTCIRRCCNDGELIVKGNATSYCHKDESGISYHSFDSLKISANFSIPPVFGIKQGLDCLKYRLNPEIYADEAHSISDRDGSLYVWSTGKKYSNNQYCIEKINNSSRNDQKLYTFLCFDAQVVNNERIRFKVYPIGLLISCSFYAITFLVYLSISHLRNLPGQILICLVCNLFMAYLNIALGQLIPTSHHKMCFAIGFLIYFCLMAAFSWMNVMCFDIWHTFGSTQRKYSFRKSQSKRFILYSAYGWGLPILITVTAITITKSNLLSENLRPNFGHGRCWFTYDSPNSANLLFFSGPLGILFLINFILFVLTLRYCNRIKREIFRMQSSNMEKPILKRRFFIDKARFAMNTKLFVVMGITWFLELLSIVFYDRKKMFFWAISDSCNVLLGVFVFFIFVFKKRVWYLALEKCGLRNTHKGAIIDIKGHQSSCIQNSISTKNLDKNADNTTFLKPLATKRTPTM